MIYRLLFSLLVVFLIYVIHKVGVVLEIPGLPKLVSLYTSVQDICGEDLRKQLIRTSDVLEVSFKLQKDLLMKQFEGVTNVIVEHQESKFRINVVKILSMQYDSFPEKVIISAGARDGVEKYSLVLKDGFLFGRVVDVGMESSEVITVFSPMFYVDVLFLGTGNRAILQGDQSGRMKIFATYGSIDFEKIPQNTLLVTAGTKNNSPFGLPVAYVSQDKSITALSDFRNAVYLTSIAEIR